MFPNPLRKVKNANKQADRKGQKINMTMIRKLDIEMAYKTGRQRWGWQGGYVLALNSGQALTILVPFHRPD